MMTYIPKPGDFAVVSTPGVVSKLIRFGEALVNSDTRIYCNHAFIYVGALGAYRSQSIIEAEPAGARISSLMDYADVPIYWYECPDYFGNNIAKEAIALIGTPYSFLDYLSIFMYHEGPKFIASRLENYVSNTHHMICSQLVDEAYRRAGVQLFNDNRLPGNVTPEDLYGLTGEQQVSKLES